MVYLYFSAVTAWGYSFTCSYGVGKQ